MPFKLQTRAWKKIHPTGALYSCDNQQQSQGFIPCATPQPFLLTNSSNLFISGTILFPVNPPNLPLNHTPPSVVDLPNKFPFTSDWLKIWLNMAEYGGKVGDHFHQPFHPLTSSFHTDFLSVHSVLLPFS